MPLEKWPQQIRDATVCTQMKTEATFHDTPHLAKQDTNSIPPMEVSCGSPNTVRRGICVINLPIGISKRIKQQIKTGDTVLPQAAKHRDHVTQPSHGTLLKQICFQICTPKVTHLKSSCLHRASIVSKHFLLFQLMHTIIKS
jgi:hypothetical protein